METQKASQIQPGRSLGWITLGSSLHSIITRLKAQPQIYPKLDLSYSATESVLEPIILNLPANGLRLRFDGPDQRLRLIEVLDFSKTSFTYKNTELIRRSKSSEDQQDQVQSSQGPTFRHVYNRLFGPAYAGEYVSPESGLPNGTYVLSYPGLAFSFPVKHKSWSDKADFVSILSSTATAPATSMAVFQGPSWPEARTSLYTKPPSLPRSASLANKAAESVPDEIEEVRIHGAGKIELIRRTSPPMEMILSETTPQDLIAELGPPDAIYRKNDSRISIHATNNSSKRGRHPSMSPALDAQGNDTDQSSLQSYTDDSDNDTSGANDNKTEEITTECFFNYFHHGFDVLISTPKPQSPPFPGMSASAAQDTAGCRLVVTKLLLHANVPGSYSFNRHRRSRWTIVTGQDDQHRLHSEMRFSQISKILKQVWHGQYSSPEEEKKLQRGMVLNRGWGESPESSIELLGGFEESAGAEKTAVGSSAGESLPSLSNTELFGFPGLLFEVLKNDHVSCLTIY